MTSYTPLTQSFRTDVIMSLCSGYGHAGVAHTERVKLYKFLTDKLLPAPGICFDSADVASEVHALLAKQLPDDLMRVICRETIGEHNDESANEALARFPLFYSLRKPNTSWAFKALPEAVDFGCILREAPDDARLVVVTCGPHQFLFLRRGVGDSCVSHGVPYCTMFQGMVGSFRLSRRSGSNVPRWDYQGTLDGWLSVPTTTESLCLARAKEMLKALDEAVAKEKAKREAAAREAQKFEVKVEAF